MYKLCQLRIEVHFVFFNIMNEILQHPELMHTFLVGNHCHFLGRLSNQMQSIFLEVLMNTIKKLFKKSGHKMDLYPAMDINRHTFEIISNIKSIIDIVTTITCEIYYLHPNFLVIDYSIEKKRGL